MSLGFKARISLCVAFVLTLSFALLSAINTTNLSDNMITNLSENTQLKLSYESDNITNWMMEKQAAVGTAAAHFSPEMNKLQNLGLINLLAESHEFSNVIVAYENGETFHYNNSSASEKIEATSRPWYQLAKSNRKTSLTKIYKDIYTGKAVISIAAPIYDNGQFSGVLLGDLLLSQVTDKISAIRFAGGAAAMVDNENVFIASDDPSDLGKTPSQVSAVFKPMEQAFSSQVQGQITFPYLGIEFIGYFQQIRLTESQSWTLMVFIDQETALQDVNASVIRSALISLGLLIAGLLVMTAVLSLAYRPITALKDAVLDLSKGSGDLTRRLTVKGNDDLAQISQGFNEFTTKLQHMMLDVTTSSREISEEVALLDEQIKHNEEILKEHASQADQIVTAIAEMSATADSVAQSVGQAAEYAESTNNQAANSKGVVDAAVNNVGSLVNEVETMSDNIVSLSQDTQKIGSVLNVIGEIAEQTNLLALNAAIEAARAGEQGRGFAVVADEVRALAARTQTSTSEINTMLDSLKNGTSEVVNAMDNTRNRCEFTATSTAEVSTNLDAVSHSISEISDLSSQIATAAEQQSTVSEDINRNMETIRDMVNELTRSGQLSVDATEQLANSNRNLVEMVNKFKVS